MYLLRHASLNERARRGRVKHVQRTFYSLIGKQQRKQIDLQG